MLIATTGGTLGVVRSGRFFTAGSDLRGLLLAALEEMPGWHIEVEQVGSAGDSADATPDSWFAIAGHLASCAPDCAAVVLIHGADAIGCGLLHLTALANERDSAFAEFWRVWAGHVDEPAIKATG